MKRYGRLVWYWCYLYTRGDDGRARDLTQDVWLLVWDNSGRLRPDATAHELRAWLKALVRTASSRQMRRAMLPIVPLTDDIDVADDSSVRQMRDTLEALMAHLPDDDRRLIGLLLDGYRLDEAARQLAITPVAAQQRYHRAVRRMKEISKQYNISPL